MKDRSIHEEVVAKALFDTLDESERRAVEAHLAACAACAEEVRALRGVLAVTAERVRPEPPPAFWDGYARRVEERLAARMEAERQASWSGRLDAWRRSAAAALTLPVPRWTYQLAAAVVLVGLGVLIGKAYFGAPAGDTPAVVEHHPPAPPPDTPPPDEPEPATDEPAPVASPEAATADRGAPVPQTAPARRPAAPAPDEGNVRPAMLETRARHYMDRSKVLLLGLVNFDPSADDPAALDLPRRQAAARRLVDEAAPLKDDLAAADEQRLRELVADLEVILLQIANLEAEHDVPAIEMVRSGVDRRALLLKINVEQMRLAEPDADEGTPRGTAPSI